MESSRDSLLNELSGVDKQIESIEQEINYLEEEKRSLIEKRSVLQVQIDSLNDQQPAEAPEKTPSANRPHSTHSTTDWENGRFPWTDRLHSTLSSQFSLDSFRPLQLSCINATLSDHDVILLMPTGGGKSLCYQLPAVINEGFTLVISPLVSLMQDQLRSVERLGIDSCMLDSNSTKQHVSDVHAKMVDKNNKALKLVYVTPEKVAKSKRFMSKLEKAYNENRLSRIVIDEVHCASQWGHDFRPDYKILGILKRQFPSVPILGLTATATVKVLEDCKTLLRLDPSCVVFKASYNRPNLFYEIRDKPSSHKDHLNDIVGLIQNNFNNQSGILYCLSQKESEEMCRNLNASGIQAGCYHAGMTSHDRTESHMNWIDNKIQVIVATVAFGMGIDKGDVRFVIHHSISKSMENYYQESGRAGRDGKVSVCILYYRIADLFRQSTMVQAEYTGIQNLYSMINYCINQSKCRRNMVAHHFGDVWNERDCMEMCDICAKQKQVNYVEEDVSQICKGFIEILETTKQKLTAAKLVDSWKTSEVAKSLSKKNACSVRQLEYILAMCLMKGVVREEYHFTPYNTISYIVKGARARALVNNRMELKMVSRDITCTTSLKYPMKRVFGREVTGPTSVGLESTSTSSISEVTCPVVATDSASESTTRSTPQPLSASSVSLKRKHTDSCKSSFSEIDEDFKITPKRPRSLSKSKGHLKKGGSGIIKFKKSPGLSTSKSQLVFVTSAESKDKASASSNIQDDIIEINSDSSD